MMRRETRACGFMAASTPAVRATMRSGGTRRRVSSPQEAHRAAGRLRCAAGSSAHTSSDQSRAANWSAGWGDQPSRASPPHGSEAEEGVEERWDTRLATSTASQKEEASQGGAPPPALSAAGERAYAADAADEDAASGAGRASSVLTASCGEAVVRESTAHHRIESHRSASLLRLIASHRVTVRRIATSHRVACAVTAILQRTARPTNSVLATASASSTSAPHRAAPRGASSSANWSTTKPKALGPA